MKFTKSMISVLSLLMISLSLGQDGKIPITTSSEKAMEYYQKGIAFQNNFQLIKAAPMFKEALKLDPNFAMAQLGLAGSLAQPKFRQEAFQKLFVMVKTAPISEGEKLFFDAMEAGFAGDQAKRMELIFKLEKMYPKDELILSNVANYYNGRGEVDKAIEVFERIIKYNPDYLPVYNTLGYTYRGQGRIEDAERIFKKAISINPENPNAYDSYAELLLKLGRFDESIENYEQALKIDHMFPSAVMGIASNLLHKEMHDDAITRLERIQQIAPNDNIRGGVSWAKSVVYLDKNDVESAIKEMNRNLDYSKKVNDVSSMGNDYSNLMRIHRLTHNYKKAREYATKAMESFVQTSNTEQQKINTRKGALFSFIILDLKEGNLERAKTQLKEYEEFVLAQPNNRFWLFNLHELNANVAFVEKRYADVISELDQAQRWQYNNMHLRAKAYEAMGEADKAKAEYRLIAESRGALNFEYSVYRHEAMKKLAAL